VLEAYLMLDGRMRRRGYLGYSILLWIIMAIGTPLAVWGASRASYHPHLVQIVVLVVAILFLAWATIALAAKRLHDRNQSGWWALVMLPGVGYSLSYTVQPGLWAFGLGAGCVGLIFFLYLVFARGTDGPNRFGYPP
jgi:uncharacterized membrane protein YhaH (DUF805 family)